MTERRCYAPTFGIEHVEHQDEILDESERLRPAPPPTEEPSAPIIRRASPPVRSDRFPAPSGPTTDDLWLR